MLISLFYLFLLLKISNFYNKFFTFGFNFRLNQIDPGQFASWKPGICCIKLLFALSVLRGVSLRCRQLPSVLLTVDILLLTEHCMCVVSTHASCIGSVGLQSGVGGCPEFLRFTIAPSDQFRTNQINHDRFFPLPFQFIIHKSLSVDVL
jgi:hypothetical protein